MFSENGHSFMFMGVRIKVRAKVQPCHIGIDRFVLEFELISVLHCDGDKALRGIKLKVGSALVEAMLADLYEKVELVRDGEIIVVPADFSLDDAKKIAFEKLVKETIISK